MKREKSVVWERRASGDAADAWELLIDDLGIH
jgi:hypothetical protein